MEEDTEPYEDNVPEVIEEIEEVQEEPVQEAQQVPLSALQKERRKRQEAEQELNYLRKRSEEMQRKPAPEPEEDNSRYESATKEDLTRARAEVIRDFEERQWIKSNPELYNKVNEELPNFLKQRPNYASAINDAQNRYEEALSIMTAFTPKQAQQKVVQTQKREAPNAPGGVPKSTAMSHSVDVMNMSDKEFHEWRGQQKKRR